MLEGLRSTEAQMPSNRWVCLGTSGFGHGWSTGVHSDVSRGTVNLQPDCDWPEHPPHERIWTPHRRATRKKKIFILER